MKLWHFSDGPIQRFEPRDGLVWAIDDAHAPSYWFPRDVPRGTWWADESTTDEDLARFLGDAPRVHAIQREWLDEFRAGRVYAHRLPPATFVPHDDVAGYWVSREAVEPAEVIELSGLEQRHAEHGIELRVVDDLQAVWDEVIASTVVYSGIRLPKLVRRT